MDNFLNRLNRNPYQPIDSASITRVDELGNGYDDWNNLIAPKFEQPQQTWGETALGVATAPARMATALAGSLSPYGADGWQVPPIVNEGWNALTAVGDAYNYGMPDDEINSRALGMAGFMMGGGGLAAKSPVSRAANLFPDQPRAMSSDLFAEAVPAGERFGARTAAADPRQSKHWPSWGDREPDRAAAHVREQEAADAWFSIVDPIMYDERGLKRMERHEAEALAIERFPDALDKGFAYKEAAKAWNEIDKGRPMTAAEQAWFDLDLAPGRARTSRNEIMRDIVMPNMIMPDGSTGVQHMAAANGPKKLYSNASKEGAASIYGGLLDRLSSAYAPDDQLNMFGGRNAKTANLERLAIAERLAAEGADRNAIWNETGWFQGPDSKWRFEIDDSGASFSPAGSTFAEIYDNASGFKSMGDVLSHQNLYGAYPDTAYLGLGISKGDVYGSFGGRGVNDLEIKGSSPRGEAMETLLHEGQHAIQATEGFANGGNSESIGLKDYERLAGEVEARNVQTRMNMSADQRRATPPWETQDIPDIDQIVRLYSNASKEGAVPAIASALDMSPEARLARAKEMGFDTDETLYRGATSFEDFDGPTWFTVSPEYAGNFPLGNQGETAIAPIFTRGTMLDLTKYPADHGFTPETFKKAVGIFHRRADDALDTLVGPLDQEFEAYAALDLPEIQDALNGYYSGVRVNQYVAGDGSGAAVSQLVFDPRNIRSVNAAFDPAMSDSANLLAANADSRPALLASALGQDDIPDWLLPYLPPQ